LIATIEAAFAAVCLGENRTWGRDSRLSFHGIFRVQSI